MGLIARLKLRGPIKAYKSFFAEQESYFKRLYPIPEHISDHVTDVYKELKKDPKRYNELIKQYDNYLERVTKHNEEVKYIENNISDFDYKSIIKNPLNFVASSIDKYVKAAKLLEKYSGMDKKYLELKKQILNLSQNVEGLKIQFKLLPEYRSSIAIPKDCYIDREKRNDIYAKAAKVREKLNQTGKVRFYDFSSIDIIGKIIEEANEAYIEKHLKDKMLSDVNGKSLDTEQRKAAIQDENASLTIAGAGSGKTLTICGKVKFLIEKQGVNPNDILLLSYSKNSADDLERKIKSINKDLTVGTFHKIGLEILKNVKKKSFVVEEQFKSIIEKYFREEMSKRPNMQERILRYYSLFLSNNNFPKKYNDKGELFDDLKKSDFKTLRNQLTEISDNVRERETLKHEFVKSFEEMALANFYFINGINYEYEHPYEHDVSSEKKRQYTPDFYLPEYKIYHEHYGIDENEQANQFKGEEADNYIKTMHWKRDLHKEHKTICLETYSYEFQDGSVFDKLTKELKAKGVKFKPLSGKEISNTLNSIYQERSFKSLINLIRSFISLYKAKYTNNKGFNALKEHTYPNKFESIRGAMFLDICKDIYDYYMNLLRSNNKIDFDDMISQSTECLDKTKSFKYKYIIVDEFQDISFSRMRFLVKLIEHGNAKLFAVGDDWQAIYRFSGCDLNIFLNFDKYFGETRTNYITATHRNSQELQDITGPFIRANKQQFNKIIKSELHLNKPIQIAYYDDNKSMTLIAVLKRIYLKNKNAKILLLGRNNFDIDSVLSNNLYFDRSNPSLIHCANYPTLQIRFCTVHSSKGLEEDYVILISADDERNGFPNKLEDDPLLDLVLSKKSDFEFAEERRLWYVALTRTRSYTYIIANRVKPSIFVNEILNQCFIMNPKHEDMIADPIACPNCKSGHLILREGSGEPFYGCSNYPYCNYTNNDVKAVNANKRCPDCGDFLVIRKNKNGKFYGCSNYPECRYTRPLYQKK